MAILGALSIARSGLVATGEALSVTGNNIANVNTTAFKGSRPEFADLLEVETGGGNGLGVRLADSSTSFVQGAIENTSRPTDLAIEGRGFFVVKEGEGFVYTRAGNFVLNSDAQLVTGQGHMVQGYALDALNNPIGPEVDIDFGNIATEVSSTSRITLQNNLSANADDSIGPFDGTQGWNEAYATSNYTSTVRVYDSLGNQHELTLFFTKTGANAWEVNVGADAGKLEPAGTAGELSLVGSPISLTFDSEGALTAPGATDINVTFQGAAAQDISLDFGTPTAAPGDGLGRDGIVQLGGVSSVAGTQDGFGAGLLRSVSVQENGIVVGHFDNGQSRPIYQLALADFAAPDRLSSLGNGLFRESVGSGIATIVTPDSAGLGRVIEQSIERSNVDLATEFVNLISLQRAFQANARVITTSDGLLNDLLNIVR